MKLFCTLCMIILCATTNAQSRKYAKEVPAIDRRPVLVIHGGAGTILKSQMTDEKEAAYKAGLKEALTVGYSLLKAGGSSLDAVTEAVKILENNPLFNAGKGAVFTNAGKNELDAAIMDGSSLKAGSVAGITTVKNPITAARAVMEKTEHVMLAGKGADEFAKSVGCEIVDPSYFRTDARYAALQKALLDDSLKTINKIPEPRQEAMLKQPSNRDNKYGTVGAVALDTKGNLAAATSTGGMTNKKYGRIGDAPIIGTGTYADNNTCAISCTGWGEYFIRLVMAKTISDRMEFGKQTLKVASDEMVQKKLPALGGDGGLIALDKIGNIAMPFNTAGMYRGYVDKEGKMVIEIYK